MLRMQEDASGAFVLLEGERINLTPQQQYLVETIRDSTSSLGLIAVAGSGKTFSLRISAAEFSPSKRTLACAFNKHNQLALSKTMPGFVTCKTFNGIGHSAWQTFLRKRLRLDEGKVGKLVSEECRLAGRSDLWGDVKTLVTLCKGYGITPLPESLLSTLGCRRNYGTERDLEELAYQRHVDKYEDAFPLACSVLTKSIRLALAGEIDFSDQIYMSVCWKVRYEKYHNVLVDEAQDLNHMNHVQVRQSLMKENEERGTKAGRLIVVGDPNQSIYGFRGSVANGMDLLIKSYNCEELGLTVCFRCGSKIVDRARELVPHIQSAEGAEEGEVKTLKSWDYQIFKTGDAILCRNNAPLVSTAFYLIRNRVSVVMLGRDIGKSLQAVLKKVARQKDMEIDLFWHQLEAWERNEVSKAIAKQDDHMIDSIHDRAQTIREVAEAVNASDIGELSSEIESLFARNTGNVTLSTVHKAKGMEWDTVYILEPNLMPPPWLVRKSREIGDPEILQQEKNVDYVARTRAKKSLCYIYSSGREGDERKLESELHETKQITTDLVELPCTRCKVGNGPPRGWIEDTDRKGRVFRVRCPLCNGQKRYFCPDKALGDLPEDDHLGTNWGDSDDNSPPKFLTRED